MKLWGKVQISNHLHYSVNLPLEYFKSPNSFPPDVSTHSSDRFLQSRKELMLSHCPSVRRILCTALTDSSTLATTKIPSLCGSHAQALSRRAAMTTATFKHIDLSSSIAPKPWAKVDGPGSSFKMRDYQRPVHNIRDSLSEFTTDNAGFAVYHSPAQEKSFTDDKVVREGYYGEVDALLRERLPGVTKVVIFDHTIRRRQPDAPRQPVQQVHVDQTPGAAAARVRRHLPAAEAEQLLQRRYQIINVWRPIAHAAADFPLAVIDWRSTRPADFVPVDLMYPQRADSPMEGDPNDDRGKEKLPDPNSWDSTEGYEVKGETLGVAANEHHKFYYVKDMTPEEVMLLKCFDSRGEGMPEGWEGEAVRTPHTAFIDPQTRPDAPGRQSIEVRCLVFY